MAIPCGHCFAPPRRGGNNEKPVKQPFSKQIKEILVGLGSRLLP
jgi:hypothetical protein